MTYFYVFSGVSHKVIFNILCRCPNIFSIKIRFQPLKPKYWKTEALSYLPNFLHNTSQLGDLVFHRTSMSSYTEENSFNYAIFLFLSTKEIVLFRTATYLPCKDRDAYPANQPHPPSCHCQKDAPSDNFQRIWRLEKENK